MTQAIILIGHGSRDPLWHLPIQSVAQRIRATSPGKQVACAYLELTQPTLADVTAEFVSAGATHIRVLPMFFGTGRHAREDLPLLIAALRASYPNVHFDAQAAVGENEAVLDLLAKIALGSSVD